jgi:hypothetical protein
MSTTYHLQRRAILALGLKTARRLAGLSALAASRLIAAQGIKCQRGTLLAWERAFGPTSREPFASDLATIAQVYGCSVESLYRDPSSVQLAGDDTMLMEMPEMPV